MLYGCEVWNTIKKQLKRFEVFHQRCLRRILAMKWFHKVIAAMRLRWYGHVVRMPDERLPKYLMTRTPKHEKLSRQRPRRSWIDCVKEDAADFTGINNISMQTMEGMVTDREQWRAMIKNKRRFLAAGHSND